MSTDDHLLIESLIAARHAQHLDLAEMAKRMDTSFDTVARIERTANPTLHELHAYALAVGVVIEHTVRQA